MKQPRNLEKVVARVGELPAVPEVVTEALALLDNPAAEMNEIAAVIEKDPALAARILRMSNSPCYGLKRQVGSVKLAAVVLGTRELRSIVIATSIYGAAVRGLTESPLAHDLWRHSLLTAGLCKRLGVELRLGYQGEDFLVGLLHDIGKLVLWSSLQKPYEELLSRRMSDGPPLHAFELDRYGFTHADVAAALARHWGLPEGLCDALWLHHPRADMDLHDTADPRLAALVRVGNQSAHVDDAAEGYATGDAEAWRILEGAPIRLAPARREEVLGGFRIELQLAPVPAW